MTERSKKEVDQIVARMDFLRDLLKEFGASLYGYDPGVSAVLPNPDRPGYAGTMLDFERGEWAWLEPLLVELREKRERNAALHEDHSTKE